MVVRVYRQVSRHATNVDTLCTQELHNEVTATGTGLVQWTGITAIFTLLIKLQRTSTAAALG